MKHIKLALFSLGLLSIVSCSGIKKMALAPTSQIIYDASFEQTVETDWQMFENSLDANIKLIEGLHSQSPENKNLLVTLQKAYVGKAFAVNETLYLEDFLAERENSYHLKRALINYTKALHLGIEFLKVSGIEGNLMRFQATPEKLMSELEDKLSDDINDLEGAFYLGQALGSLVNLQRTNMKAIAFLPVAKALIDWACMKDPKLNHGACEIFYASYESGRPRMLGGNPALGRKKFLEGIKNWPDNWLMRASFVQFYAVPMVEEDDFDDQKRFFKTNAPLMERAQIWRGDNFDPPTKSYVSVYNLIAIKRMKIFEKYQKDIF